MKFTTIILFLSTIILIQPGFADIGTAATDTTATTAIPPLKTFFDDNVSEIKNKLVNVANDSIVQEGESATQLIPNQVGNQYYKKVQYTCVNSGNAYPVVTLRAAQTATDKIFQSQNNYGNDLGDPISVANRITSYCNSDSSKDSQAYVDNYLSGVQKNFNSYASKIIILKDDTSPITISTNSTPGSQSFLKSNSYTCLNPDAQTNSSGSSIPNDSEYSANVITVNFKVNVSTSTGYPILEPLETCVNGTSGDACLNPYDKLSQICSALSAKIAAQKSQNDAVADLPNYFDTQINLFKAAMPVSVVSESNTIVNDAKDFYQKRVTYQYNCEGYGNYNIVVFFQAQVKNGRQLFNLDFIPASNYTGGDVSSNGYLFTRDTGAPNIVAICTKYQNIKAEQDRVALVFKEKQQASDTKNALIKQQANDMVKQLNLKKPLKGLATITPIQNNTNSPTNYFIKVPSTYSCIKKKKIKNQSITITINIDVNGVLSYNLMDVITPIMKSCK